MTIFWFRRDLRLDDNAGLYHALRSGQPVQCVFIFDKDILDLLEDKNDRRVVFIHRQIKKLSDELNALGSSLLVKVGKPMEIWKEIINDFKVKHVFTNHDYETYAKQRDESIKSLLEKNSITFSTFKDQVIFEKDEVMKDDGTPYTVYTPYMKKWRSKLTPFFLSSYPTEKYFNNFVQSKVYHIPTLEDIGFADSEIDFPHPTVKKDLLAN